MPQEPFFPVLTTRRPRTAFALLALLFLPAPALAGPSLADVIADVQPKMVKIYGAGGFRQLEAYQSGYLISPDGHVLTVWSYVLDTDFITVTLDDGRKFEAELLGADPRLEIAVLKIDASDLPHFNLGEAAEAIVGDRVLAFSNLYGVATGDEPASVQKGIVSAVTELTGRRGAFETPYDGPVYVVDAMTNNPGAAGGALTDREGRLLALLGKELRNELSSTWLNYAVPISELIGAADDIMAGKVRPRGGDQDVRRPLDPLTLSRLGIIPVPAVLPQTPPFIDAVRPGTPADEAGLQPDDLILFVNNRIVSSLAALQKELGLFDRDDPVRLIVQRGQKLIDVTLGGRRGNSPP
jgi:S1-C subfamily serine protease